MNRGLILLLTGVSLAGCGMNALDRPAEKPDALTVELPTATRGGAVLTEARISTKSGKIQILEPDGSVTTMELDSLAGTAALRATQPSNGGALPVGLDLASLPQTDVPQRQTEADRQLEAFAKRTTPLLPKLPQGVSVRPDDLIALQVQPTLKDLVTVRADLRPGVDPQLAFAYATCALAGWADANDLPFARHVRTLTDEAKGRQMVDAAYTLSQERPLGLEVMETNVTLRECESQGIPAA